MIPGDLSSTAYAIVMAALLPDSFLLVKDVGMNPTRTGILEVLRSVGVCYEVTNLREHFGEPLADLTIWGSDVLKPFCVEKNIVPRLIDEVPILAVLATQCEGVSEFRGLQELRVKESDRILKMSEGLRSMGAKVEVFEDGFAITGPTELKGARINPAGDHRIAMAFTVAGFIANGETIIEGRGCIATSYPGFTKQLREVCVF
jgi:3-phosphoshikimate 1-carboxyvinyltransferase